MNSVQVEGSKQRKSGLTSHSCENCINTDVGGRGKGGGRGIRQKQQLAE